MSYKLISYTYPTVISEFQDQFLFNNFPKNAAFTSLGFKLIPISRIFFCNPWPEYFTEVRTQRKNIVNIFFISIFHLKLASFNKRKT